MDETTENTGEITQKRKGRVENLRPWQKGVSGNPGGRPRGIFGKAALRLLRKRAESGETNLDSVVGAQMKKAIHKGDTRAAEFLRDSVDGRPSASDSNGTNIGTVNIIWNGEVPSWASEPPLSLRPPQTVPSQTATLPCQPIPLPDWVQTNNGDEQHLLAVRRK